MLYISELCASKSDDWVSQHDEMNRENGILFAFKNNIKLSSYSTKHIICSETVTMGVLLQFMEKYVLPKVSGLQHWSLITMQTDVLLSLEETTRITKTKPSFTPKGMETRMSHLPWGGCFHKLVAFDPFRLETCKSACPKMEKKNLERETKRAYTESDAAGQLEPCQIERTFRTIWT